MKVKKKRKGKRWINHDNNRTYNWNTILWWGFFSRSNKSWLNIFFQLAGDAPLSQTFHPRYDARTSVEKCPRFFVRKRLQLDLSGIHLHIMTIQSTKVKSIYLKLTFFIMVHFKKFDTPNPTELDKRPTFMRRNKMFFFLSLFYLYTWQLLITRPMMTLKK